MSWFRIHPRWLLYSLAITLGVIWIYEGVRAVETGMLLDREGVTTRGRIGGGYSGTGQGCEFSVNGQVYGIGVAGSFREGSQVEVTYLPSDSHVARVTGDMRGTYDSLRICWGVLVLCLLWIVGRRFPLAPTPDPAP